MRFFPVMAGVMFFLCAAVRAEDASVVVNVTCVNHEKSPMAGVEVTFTLYPPEAVSVRNGVTDRNGVCTVELPRTKRATLEGITRKDRGGLFLTGCEGDVSFGDNPAGPYCPYITPREDGTASVTLRFGPPTSKVTGRISDNLGNPLRDAAVTVSPDWFQGTTQDVLNALTVGTGHCGPLAGETTGENGVFVIPVPPGRYSIFSIRPKSNRLLYWAELLDDEPPVMTAPAKRGLSAIVKMDEGGALDVDVRDASATPVAGARAEVLQVRMTRLSPSGPDPAGDDGVVRIGGIPEGRYAVKVTPPDGSYLAPVQVDTDIARGKTARLDVTLPRGAIVRGRVTGEKGSPLSGYVLGSRVETDKDGRYEARGLPAGDALFAPDGRHPLLRFAGDSPDRICMRVEEGKEYVRDIALRRLAAVALTGRVTTSDGAPVKGVQVFLRKHFDHGLYGAQKHHRVVTSGDGTYRMVDIYPGRIHVELWPPDDVPFDVDRRKAIILGIDEH